MLSRAAGAASLGAGSAGSGAGCSSSGLPNPRCAARNSAVARCSPGEGCSSSYPQPQCFSALRHGGPAYPATVRGRGNRIGLLARGPWEPAQVDVAWRADTFEPPASSIEAADAALDALRERGLAEPRRAGRAAGRATSSSDGRLALELQRGALGAAAAARGRRPEHVGAVHRPGRRRPLAGRPPRRLAGLLGRSLGAGRRRRRSRSTRTRPRRWAASSRRNGRCSPSGCGSRRWCGCPARSCCWSVRPGSPKAPRSPPTTSTTSSPGGRPTSSTGRPRPTSRCGGWPRCSPPA